MNVTLTIETFDRFLSVRGLTFEATIIGGAALSVLKIITRETVDIDCLAPQIPKGIINAAEEFRMTYPELKLMKGWLNNGPENLKIDLGEGWETRLVEIYHGDALILTTLARVDLIKTKMFAYCDRQTDLQDCLALNPDEHELTLALKWVKERDANPEWEKYVEQIFTDFQTKLKR
jgi:hypothetical protein